MIYSTGSHTKFYHRFHVVWTTKYRYKVMRGEMRERIREIIIQTCQELGVHIEKGVLSTDHVHMFISVPPQIALSKVMMRIKGRSSYKIQREFPELRKRYWGQRFWARGFFSTTSKVTWLSLEGVSFVFDDGLLVGTRGSDEYVKELEYPYEDQDTFCRHSNWRHVHNSNRSERYDTNW